MCLLVTRGGQDSTPDSNSSNPDSNLFAWDSNLPGRQPQCRTTGLPPSDVFIHYSWLSDSVNTLPLDSKIIVFIAIGMIGDSLE